MDIRSICSAIRGKCSQISNSPRVAIGLKGPPFGESGFMSHMSMDEGPPPNQIKMAD
jgi:hypothetical protein